MGLGEGAGEGWGGLRRGIAQQRSSGVFWRQRGRYRGFVVCGCFYIRREITVVFPFAYGEFGVSVKALTANLRMQRRVDLLLGRRFDKQCSAAQQIGRYVLITASQNMSKTSALKQAFDHSSRSVLSRTLVLTASYFHFLFSSECTICSCFIHIVTPQYPDVKSLSPNFSPLTGPMPVGGRLPYSLFQSLDPHQPSSSFPRSLNLLSALRTYVVLDAKAFLIGSRTFFQADVSYLDLLARVIGLEFFSPQKLWRSKASSATEALGREQPPTASSPSRAILR